MIVLDTCILSEVFRKHTKDTNQSIVDTMRQMIEDDWPLVIPGIVLQEFLTGFRGEIQFQRASEAILGFKTIFANHEDHVLAAHLRSSCTKNGIQCAAIDALIAAMTINANGRLMTIDRDFLNIARVCHLKLFEI